MNENLGQNGQGYGGQMPQQNGGYNQPQVNGNYPNQQGYSANGQNYGYGNGQLANGQNYGNGSANNGQVNSGYGYDQNSQGYVNGNSQYGGTQGYGAAQNGMNAGNQAYGYGAGSMQNATGAQGYGTTNSNTGYGYGSQNAGNSGNQGYGYNSGTTAYEQGQGNPSSYGAGNSQELGKNSGTTAYEQGQGKQSSYAYGAGNGQDLGKPSSADQTEEKKDVLEGKSEKKKKERSEKSALALTGLILCCISIPFLGPILSIPGMLCCIIALITRTKDKKAIAGLIIGVISTTIYVFLIFAVIRVVNVVSENVDNVMSKGYEFDIPGISDETINEFLEKYMGEIIETGKGSLEEALKEEAKGQINANKDSLLAELELGEDKETMKSELGKKVKEKTGQDASEQLKDSFGNATENSKNLASDKLGKATSGKLSQKSSSSNDRPLISALYFMDGILSLGSSTYDLLEDDLGTVDDIESDTTVAAYSEGYVLSYPVKKQGVDGPHIFTYYENNEDEDIDIEDAVVTYFGMFAGKNSKSGTIEGEGMKFDLGNISEDSSEEDVLSYFGQPDDVTTGSASGSSAEYTIYTWNLDGSYVSITFGENGIYGVEYGID